MRNSEARNYARWSAGVAILLVLVVAGVYLHRDLQVHRAEREAPPAVPATIEQRSADFSFSKVEGQRTVYTVRASHATEFKEGNRNLLQDVSIVVYGQKGDRNDTLRTGACDFISSTGKITCAGEVEMNLQPSAPHAADNIIQVVTSNITFDRNSGETQTDQPVTFRWPTGNGRSIGVQYDSNTGTLRLSRSVELDLKTPPAAPSRAEPPQQKDIQVTSNSLVFRREAHTLQMLGAVHAHDPTHELMAETLLVDLDDSFHARHFSAGGQPHFRASDRQGPITLDADQISAAVTAEGSVGSIMAAGHVHGSRTAANGEDGIEAGRVQLDLATRQNVPRLLTAGDGVVLTSRSAMPAGGTRRLESKALEVHFLSASKGGETLLESVNTLAPAQIDWQNMASADGKPAKQTMRMRGRYMQLQFDRQNQLKQLVSTGGVEVTRQLGDGPQQTTTSRELAGNFSGSQQWSTIDQTGDVRFQEGSRTAQGERAHMDRASDTVTLTGAVVLSDTTMRTTAQSATFTQGSNELRADGNVLSSQLRAVTGSFPNLAQEPARIRADHLLADAAHGHATYTGGCRLWQGDTVLEADRVELDNPSRVMVATGRVRGIFPEAAGSPTGVPSAARPANRTINLWRVQGGLLTYWDTESRAMLEQDASAESAEGSIRAARMDLYFSAASPDSATRQISRAVANGDVTVQQAGRRATSSRADYSAAEGKFVLSGGRPTLYDATGGTTTGRQLTFFLADDRIIVDSEEGSRTVTLHRVEK